MPPKLSSFFETAIANCKSVKTKACVTWILVGKQLNMPMDIIYLIGKHLLQNDYIHWIGAYDRYEEQVKKKVARLLAVKQLPKYNPKFVPPISRAEKKARNRQVKQQLKIKSKR
jgi:hypothetical protein